MFFVRHWDIRLTCCGRDHPDVEFPDMPPVAFVNLAYRQATGRNMDFVRSVKTGEFLLWNRAVLTPISRFWVLLHRKTRVRVQKS